MGSELVRILSAREGIEEVMGDVVRVLHLSLGSLWLPEVIMELRGFKETLQEEMPKEDIIEEAVRRLSELGIVTLEEGVRASLSGRNERTYLVRLRRDPELVKALAGDEKIAKYRDIWRRVFQT